MNRLSRLIVAVPAFVGMLPLAAQQPAKPRFDLTGVGDTSIFAPLVLPTPTQYARGSGAPGARYWQNRADYDLRGTLDTAAKTARGRDDDALHQQLARHAPLHLDAGRAERLQGRARSTRSSFPPDSRFGARDFEGGDVFERFEQVIGGAEAAKVAAQDARRRAR